MLVKMTRVKNNFLFLKLTIIVLFANMIICLNATLQTLTQKNKDCWDGPSSLYNGTHNYTKSGIPCQRWNESYPHQSKYQYGKIHHNYCRNLANDLNGLWCYTTSTNKRWEACDVPQCENDGNSLVVWTNYDRASRSSHIVSVHANPETVHQMTDYGIFNVSVVVKSNRTPAEFWAITGDYEKQQLFYTDYMSEYIGVRDLKQNKTTKIFEGMAHGIESLAHDRITGNLYWTDSSFKWVMVTEPTFRYYTPVYKCFGESAYALTIHVKSRKLYFSTLKVHGSKIIETDMAGNNERIILKYPLVSDVTGLTVDYANERLYWTDYTGFGSLVMSSDMNGNKLLRHLFKPKAIFWGIAAYRDYVYVTDVLGRSSNSLRSYTMWILVKNVPKVFKYTLYSRPRGITVLSANKKYFQTKGSNNSQDICNSNFETPCEQICLLIANGSRECACALGYNKIGETGCRAENFDDDFVLISDEGQGKIFQIPFNYTQNISHYSIVTASGENTRILALTSDPNTGYIYWADKHNLSIKKSLIDGSNKQNLKSGCHVSSMAVDPCSKNIFFIDVELQTIAVMSSGGEFVKSLLKSNLTVYPNTSLQMLELDFQARKIYWVDNKNEIGKGQVWRMNYDGTNIELVYEKLNWPRALTIDYSSQNLFIGEARTAMVYQVSLSSIVNITNTSPQSIPHQLDLSGHLKRNRVFISTLKVRDNILYFTDDFNHRMEKINITQGPASVTRFGPSDFVLVTSMSLFSRKGFAADAIQCQHTPCNTRNSPCSQLCVDLSGPKSRCLCEDGMHIEGKELTRCVKSKKENKPPTARNTCPPNIQLTVGTCSDYVIPRWKPPTWSDDNTNTSSLILKSPDIAKKLRVGIHFFIYSATDEDNLTGVCEFSVLVNDPTCGEHPVLPSDMQAKPSNESNDCGNKYGAYYVITCKDPMKLIRQNGFMQKNITNYCDNTGIWTPFTDFSGVSCEKGKAKEVIPFPTTQSNATSEKSNASIVVTNDKLSHPHSKSLGTGIIVAIILLVILIVVASAALAYKKVRRTSIPWLHETNFPIFWKRKDDNSKSSSLESCTTRVSNLLEKERGQYCRDDEPSRRSLLNNHVMMKDFRVIDPYGKEIIIEHHICKCERLESHITLHHY